MLKFHRKVGSAVFSSVNRRLRKSPAVVLERGSMRAYEVWNGSVVPQLGGGSPTKSYRHGTSTLSSTCQSSLQDNRMEIRGMETKKRYNSASGITPPISLEDVAISIIKPFKRSEHPTALNPSLFDLVAFDSYIPLILFYKPRGDESRSKENNQRRLVDNLKESLSKVLVPYFPFGGRWIKTYDNRVRVLECFDEGVPFIEASVDENMDSVVNFRDYSAVEELGGFRLMGLDPTIFSQDVEYPLPSLFVQVTRFKCGGIALHATFSHMTTDGVGLTTFMKAWSEIAMHGETSIVPNHDRSLVTSIAEWHQSMGFPAPPPPPPPHPLPAEERPVNPSDHDQAGARTVPKIDPGVALRIPKGGPIVHKTFHAKRKLIEDLKRDAVEKNMQVTTFDLITSHIWRSVAELPEDVDNKKSTHIASTMEGRKRFYNPHLPENYAGNAWLLLHAPEVSSEELSSISHLSAARIIHESVRSINPSNWGIAMIKNIALRAHAHEHPTNGFRFISVTSWFRFPLYELDFDPAFGSPVYVGPNVSNPIFSIGMARIYPPAPAISEDAIATVHFFMEHKEAANRLFSDDRFLSFFL